MLPAVSGGSKPIVYTRRRRLQGRLGVVVLRLRETDEGEEGPLALGPYKCHIHCFVTQISV